MVPKWLPGGLWSALGRRLCFQRLPGALLEGLWGDPGVSKNSLLAPWGPPGAKSWSISCFRGAAGGSRGGSGRLFWRHFCSRALRHEKSDKCLRIINMFAIVCLFFLFRLLFFRVPSLFGSARKRQTCEKCNTLHVKTCFSKVRSRAGAARKTKKSKQKTTKIQNRKSQN